MKSREIRNFAGTMLLMLAGSLQAGTLDRSDEVMRLVETLHTGDTAEQVQALETLRWRGLSDPRLFDLIEVGVKARYQSELADEQVRLMGFYLMSLAYSGDAKYRTTLREIEQSATHKKVRKYAAKALRTLPDYVVWNPLINVDTHAGAGHSMDVQLFWNMLDSGEPALYRIAAKRIYEENVKFVDPLTDAAHTRLQKMVAAPVNDKVWLDAAAWLCRALGSTGNQKYRETMQEIADGNVRKANKHCRKSLGMLSQRADWYRIVNANVTAGNAGADRQRTLNMLDSGELELIRLAARQVYWSALRRDEEVSGRAHEVLVGLTDAPRREKIFLDTLAWLCRALGASGQAAYRAAIVKVQETYPDRKIKRHTQQALQAIDRAG